MVPNIKKDRSTTSTQVPDYVDYVTRIVTSRQKGSYVIRATTSSATSNLLKARR